LCRTGTGSARSPERTLSTDGMTRSGHATSRNIRVTVIISYDQPAAGRVL
jgi:hypothetical protein